MAAAFRKLLSSEPLCVGTRNEGQETVRDRIKRTVGSQGTGGG